MRTHISRQDRAFTAVEMLAVGGVLLLICLLLLPTLATNNRGRRSERIACVNNLKQCSLAFIVWVHDQEKDHLPFRVPFWEGGTQVPTTPFPTNVIAPEWSGQQNNLWFQYAWLSNHLDNPKVLVCPSDKQKEPALTWGTAKTGGFRHPDYQDNSVSYNLWPDSGGDGKRISFEGQDPILLSDRNLNFDSATTPCSSGLSPVRTVFNNSTNVGWKPQKKFGHGTGGGIGLLDGSVSSVSSNDVRVFFRNGDYNGTLHYISPR
jgi:hypothetical protein